MKMETIRDHENSKAHKFSEDVSKAKLDKGSTIADKTIRQLNTDIFKKLSIMFKTCHAMAKNSRPLRDFNWLCKLDEAKGISVGSVYRNDKGAHSFTTSIAKSLLDDASESLSKVNFISVISDGSTDASVTEQEIVYTRFCQGEW